MKDKRTIARNESGTPVCLRRLTSRQALCSSGLFFIRSGGSISVLVLACTVGCYSMGNNGQFSRGEYTLDDDGVASTWSAAASEARQDGETHVSVMKPVELSSQYNSLGQVKEESSFSDMFAGFFHSSHSSRPSTSRTNYNGANTANSPDVQAYSDNAPYYRVSPNAASQTSDSAYHAEQDKKGGNSFWSKLFPSKKQTQNVTPSGNMMGDGSYSVNETRRDNVGAQALAEQARLQQSSAPPAGGLRQTTSRLFGRTVSPRVKRTPSRSIVEQYDQSRFLPPYKDIEKYYYPSGTVSSPSIGSSSAYGASIYRVDPNAETIVANRRQASLEQISEKMLASSSGVHRNGSAFLSPIVHADAELPVKREGNVAGRSLGVTRRIESQVREEVAQVSYDEKQLNVDGIRMSPESLFGWSVETRDVLDGFHVAQYDVQKNKESVGSVRFDSDFASALGRKVDSSWFDGLPKTAKNVNAQETNAGDLDTFAEDDLPSKTKEEDLTNEDVLVEQVEESALKTDSRQKQSVALTAEPGASLDDIFDAAVSANDPEYNSENEYATEQEDADVEYAVDAFPNAETANLAEIDITSDSSDFPSFDYSANNENVSDAATLADTIAQCSIPLEAASESDSTESVAEPLQEELLKQANIAAESARVPNSLDERKESANAAPLTHEEIEWVGQIKSAIQGLLRERDRLVEQGGNSHACDARLRLLYLVIGEYDRSIRDIQDESDPLKVFWEKECRGLETLLQNRLEEIDPSFVADRLLSGLDSLSNLCDLKVRKALLVQEPACYGLYEEHKADYSEGDVVYAYTELDYVASQETVKGYRIDVECRWRLLDSYGNVVIPFESQRCANVSETKLRDVVLNVSVPLLDKMEPGDYVLELEVVDMNASEPTTCIKKLDLNVGAREGSSI